MKIVIGETIINSANLTEGVILTLPSFAQSPLRFLNEYLNGLQSLEISTSGSTGKPKKISIERKALELSAFKTNAFFKLNEQDVFFCCMNTDYIGGKMMLIRAAELNATLVLAPHSSDPFEAKLPVKPTFMAVVPIQLRTLDKKWEQLKDTFGKLKAIIVGGGSLAKLLETEVLDFPIPIYHTYGMTETVSHIALRPINGYYRAAYYTTLPQVEVKINKNGCLDIRADVSDYKWLSTNDIVQLLSPQTFKYLGRIDFVINSGGIKIHLDTLEETIEIILNEEDIVNPIMLYGKEDEVLGTRLCMAIEDASNSLNLEDIKVLLKARLPKYHNVKEVISVPSFKFTENQKLNRIATIEAYNLK